jgi:hypothetical protein
VHKGVDHDPAKNSGHHGRGNRNPGGKDAPKYGSRQRERKGG